MANLKALLLVFLLIIFSNHAEAATIYGKVYDISLSKVPGAMVSINTTPGQFMISEDGSYSFEVQNGFYTISAEQNNGARASESRNISITQDGSYVIDLILFPSFREEEEIIEEEPGVPELESIRFVPLFVILFLAIITVIAAVIFRGKKASGKKSDETEMVNGPMKEEEYNTGLIIELMKKEGGRITQKEIRKKMPFSEAKISLMIAELEHKGLVEKIKKGRGNIIILKR